MKKFLYLLLATAMLATFGCTGDTNTNSVDSPNPNPFQPKGTVSGVLRDAETNTPLVGAKVHLMDKVAVTDEAGVFSFKKVPALEGNGNEPNNADASTYTLVIDMKDINAALTKKYVAAQTPDASRFYYPEIAYDYALPYYTSLGETSSTGTSSSSSSSEQSASSFDLGASATTIAVGGGGVFATGVDVNVNSSDSNSSSNSNSNAAVATSVPSATNHETPVDGFVCNIKPFVGMLAAAVKMQVVNAKLQPQAQAVVTLYHNSYDFSHADNSASGTAFAPANNIISTQTADANGFVTFTKIEVKQGFVAKAVTADGAQQGWFYNYAANGGAPTATAPSSGSVFISPLAGQTDVYQAQGGAVTSPGGNLNAVFSNALVVYTVDGVAPFITSVSGVSNLADIARPTSGTLDIVFNFSEPLNSTSKYAQATTQLTSIAGGIWNDVKINYIGPKAGNIAHTISWPSSTQLMISIPFDALTDGSRYTVDITQALDGSGLELNAAGTALVAGTGKNRLKDANGNNFASFASAKLTFTTSGGTGMTSTTVTPTVTNISMDWLVVPNAAQYQIWVHQVGTAMPTAPYATTAGTHFDALAPPAPALPLDFTGGKAYDVWVVPVNGMGTPGPQSNVVTLSDIAPAAPGQPTRRATTGVNEQVVDWTAVPNAFGYHVYVQTLINDTALVDFQYVAPVTDPTYNLGGLPYGNAAGQKLSYRVAIKSVSAAGSESALSPYVLIDDKTRAEAFAAFITPLPVAYSGAGVSPTPTSNITVTIEMPKQMSYASVTTKTNWPIGVTSNALFLVGKPGGTDTLPTIADISYDRTQGLLGGYVYLTLNYAASPAAPGYSWFGAAGTVVLNCSATDLNGNVTYLPVTDLGGGVIYQGYVIN